jgi:hypothetical protein
MHSCELLTCKLHQILLLRGQVKEEEFDGACSTDGTDDKYNILVGKPEGKRTWKT